MLALETGPLPRHVGIIPDGNRRWARIHGASLLEAYMQGYRNLVRIVKHINNKGVRYITVYGLSRENCIFRSREEHEIIEKVAVTALRGIREDEDLKERDIRVLILGDPRMFSPKVEAEAIATVKSSRNRRGGLLTIAICYSGRWEVENYCSKGMSPPSLLLPPIDLLIRTGGRRRLSGFFPIAAEYAELYFTDTLWPDLREEEVDRAFNWFARQERNFGR